MEQQCEIGGEGLRKNGDVVNEDRISELPEVLLLHILSSLPIKTAIATSVLSKRWKSLWKMLPNLKFVIGYLPRFSERNVSRTLILQKAPVLESLHLEHKSRCDASQMEVWIAIALARHVRKLELTLPHWQIEGPVQFPDALCRFNNTLEILKLEGSFLLNPLSPVCLKSLRELHLCYVEFKDEKAVSNLLCCCPCLEDLVVKQKCRANRLQTFTIAVPSLQRLTIEDNFYEGRGERGYVINSPSLKYLNLARLNERSGTSAKRLSLHLSPLEITRSSGKIFHQLLSLELCTNQKEWPNLLSFMLNNSPKLQNLKLIDEFVFPNMKYPLISWNWNKPECVPECLLFHLETFVWDLYEWQREGENEVATYILTNANCLKKATLSTFPIESKELELLEKRREMLKELTSVVRASDSCHLVCEAGTYEEHTSASPAETYSESSRSASSAESSTSASSAESSRSASPAEVDSESSRSSSPSI